MTKIFSVDKKIDRLLNSQLDAKRLWSYIKHELYLFYADFGLALLTVAAILTVVLNLIDAAASYQVINFFSKIIYPITSIAVISTVFKRAKSFPQNVFYLTLPATTAEKFVVAWLICTILLPASVFILLLLTSLLGSINHLFSGNIDQYSFYFLSSSFRQQYLASIIAFVHYRELVVYFLIYWLTTHMAMNATYMYGSIVFGRLAFIKTWIAMLVVGIAMLIFTQLLFFIFFGNTFNGNFDFSSFFSSYSSRTISLVALLGLVPSILLAPYLWFLAYLRLKETEA